MEGEMKERQETIRTDASDFDVARLRRRRKKDVRRHHQRKEKTAPLKRIVMTTDAFPETMKYISLASSPSVTTT
jgi:hypothetical protein